VQNHSLEGNCTAQGQWASTKDTCVWEMVTYRMIKQINNLMKWGAIFFRVGEVSKKYRKMEDLNEFCRTEIKY
jgi:hypothetical protein